MATRADRIYEIIKNNGGMMKVANLILELAKVEETEPSDLQNKIAPTVKQDNETRRSQGRAVRFRRSGEGNADPGYVGIQDLQPKRLLKNPYEEIPEFIETSNSSVKKQLKEAISRLRGCANRGERV